MAEKTVAERIAGLIRSSLHIDEIDPEADLIGGGIMDSLALVALITDIEDDFGIELPLDDFDIEAFRSVSSIADFVAGALPAEDNA